MKESLFLQENDPKRNTFVRIKIEEVLLCGSICFYGEVESSTGKIKAAQSFFGHKQDSLVQMVHVNVNVRKKDAGSILQGSKKST